MEKILKNKKFIIGFILVIILCAIFLVFGKTTNKNANSILEASSSDWDEDLEKFEFATIVN